MALKKLADNYTAYNLWANKAIVEWLQQVNTEQLYQNTPSSFTSIDYTLQHILRTQKFWLRFITGQSYADFNWSVREQEAANILRELQESSVEMKEQVIAFTEEDLKKELQLDTPWAKNTLSRYEYLFHVINHSTYHRGQIITIARCIGITEHVPNTDYNMFNTL